MDCLEAQRLIDQGTAPGSQTPLQARLGFHIAACSQCRHYYQSRSMLLQQLFEQVPEPPPTALPPTFPSAPPQQRAAQPPQYHPPNRKTPALPSIPMLLALLLPFFGLLWLISMLLDTPQPATSHQRTTTSATPAHVSQSDQESEPGQPSTAHDAALPTTPAPITSTATPSAVPTETPTHPAAQPALPTPAPTAAEPEPAQNGQAPAPSPWPTIQVLPSPALQAPPTPAHTPVPTAAALPEAIAPAAAPADPDGAVTLLLLGHDLRPGEQDIPRTDAIMLVRIDPKAYRIALLSLPRDLWVSIPGYGTNRINTAYQAGELDRPGSGLQVARSTVSTLLDIPIDYVALTGFEGFIDLVDTLGGITVNVERELYDDQFPTMDYGYTVAHFLPGPQHMDGLTALTYSRTRHPDSDFMRIRRQQNTLISIGRRLRERGNLQSMQQMEQTSREIISLVRTDMPKEQVMSLVWTMRDFDTANVERYALGAEGVTFGVGNDRYALVPSRTALDSLTRQFLGGSP